MQHNDSYITDYVEFDSIDECYEYSDKMGYQYAMSENKSLNPSPIKINGTWCLEITHWITDKPKIVGE